MKKKSFIIIFIISILFLSLFLTMHIFKFNQLKRINKNLQGDIVKMSDLCYSFNKSFNNLILFNNIALPDIMLTNSSGDNINLRNIIDAKKLVVYFTRTSCTPCIETELKVLDNFFQPNEKRRIIFISRFRSNHEIKVFEQNSGLHSFGLLHDTTLPFDNLENDVVMFLISEALYASCVFFPEKENSIVSEKYYGTIIEKLRQ